MSPRNKLLILIVSAIASWALGIGLIALAYFVGPVVMAIALFAACISFCAYDLYGAIDPVDAE